MKLACVGKPVYVSVVEYLNETGEIISNTKIAKKQEEKFDVFFVPLNETLIQGTQKQGRASCNNDNLLGACQPKPTRDTCYWWNIIGKKGVTFHMIGTTHLPQDKLCVKCCNQTGTPIIPCQCITQKQVFSTARNIDKKIKKFIYSSQFRFPVVF